MSKTTGPFAVWVQPVFGSRRSPDKDPEAGPLIGFEAAFQYSPGDARNDRFQRIYKTLEAAVAAANTMHANSVTSREVCVWTVEEARQLYSPLTPEERANLLGLVGIVAE